MSETIFSDMFNNAPELTEFTPGRVNLIGEHTDYNGGMVLPTALDLGVSIQFTARPDPTIQVHSDQFKDVAIRTLRDCSHDHWSDYVVGAIKLANAEGVFAGGADVAIQTTLPFGAGLSSSAAVTVGMLKLLCRSSGKLLPDEEIATLARRVENEFIGVPCGIMDQMAVAIASAGQALALQTDTLEYDLVDLPSDYHMAVIHSGVVRQLNEGRYKERKEECDQVKAVLGHDNICQISDAEFQTLNALPSPVQRRARHCMSEHRRTKKAVECLRQNEILKFSQLMVESHASMRDNFEITTPEIDRLVEDAVGLGAAGARMTGGGFGGCIVACVPAQELDRWRDRLLARHSDAYWIA